MENQIKIKKLKHNGFELALVRVRNGYKVIAGRSEYNYEYKIHNCDSNYNTSKRLVDWKFILENLKQYKWVESYLKQI